MPQVKLTVKELRAKLATVPDDWSVHAYEEIFRLYSSVPLGAIIFRSNNSDAELKIEVDPS